MNQYLEQIVAEKQFARRGAITHTIALAEKVLADAQRLASSADSNSLFRERYVHSRWSSNDAIRNTAVLV
ncbi:MAG: hypothetical protein GF363_12035, partial [Chitinivibrionales bacterium]|nr:hypothetical protein [Chitinivibrionales bacterium]